MQRTFGALCNVVALMSAICPDDTMIQCQASQGKKAPQIRIKQNVHYEAPRTLQRRRQCMCKRHSGYNTKVARRTVSKPQPAIASENSPKFLQNQLHYRI
jgi:hypothetical protein